LGGAPNDPRIQSDVAVVMLDVHALTRQQQDALIDHLARKFGSPRDEVARNVATRGVPIRLDDDTRIRLPEGYEPARRASKLLCGPNAYDMRFFY
jgi:hypothetical protein